MFFVGPYRYLEQQLKDLPGRKGAYKYRKVLALVIESGAIYSSALIVEITLYFLNTNAFYIVYDPIAQLTVGYIRYLFWNCVNFPRLSYGVSYPL